MKYLVERESGVQLSTKAIKEIMEFEKLAKEVEERKKEIRATILQEMEATGTVGIDTDELTITYVAPTT